MISITLLTLPLLLEVLKTVGLGRWIVDTVSAGPIAIMKHVARPWIIIIIQIILPREA